jgi:hypothetical protein
MQDTDAAPERPAVPTEDVGARNAAPPSDTQSVARRSEGDAQDTAVTAEQATIPTENATAALDALPHSDAQSSAHRSWGDTLGDTQDAAVGRPAIPREGGSAVADGSATARRVHTPCQILTQ